MACFSFICLGRLWLHEHISEANRSLIFFFFLFFVLFSVCYSILLSLFLSSHTFEYFSIFGFLVVPILQFRLFVPFRFSPYSLGVFFCLLWFGSFFLNAFPTCHCYVRELYFAYARPLQSAFRFFLSLHPLCSSLKQMPPIYARPSPALKWLGHFLLFLLFVLHPIHFFLTLNLSRVFFFFSFIELFNSE